MKKETKRQRQIMILPSVEKKAKVVEGKIGATSFSDMVEKLIMEKFNDN
jgi:predicted CopG family antitoxin